MMYRINSTLLIMTYGLMADYFSILTSNHYLTSPPYDPKYSHCFILYTPALQTYLSFLYHALLFVQVLALSLLLGCLVNSHPSFKPQLKGC